MSTNVSSSLHYHIRWLPSDLLDWQPFSSSKAAERQAERLAGKDEAYTIERFYAACGRCRSRKYSEPTRIVRQPRFLN
jgi:hypothetical protein